MHTKKHLFFISCLMITLLFTTGCSPKNETGNSETNNNVYNENENQNQQNTTVDENFTQANIDDLAIGQFVMVMSTEDSSGNATANQIIIGDNETDFTEFNNSLKPAEDDGQTPPSDIQMPKNNDEFLGTSPENMNEMPDRPDFKQFENISDEEREAMMEEMRTNRANSSGQPTIKKQTITSYTGEITKKDNSSITLKLDDGGSILIFLSKNTKVGFVKADEQINQ